MDFLPLMMAMMFLSGCANQLLLFPSTDPIDLPHALRDQIPAADHRVIEVWRIRSGGADRQEPQALVLRLCGNGERAEFAAMTEPQLWGDLPVEIWAMNYPGFGRSTGPATLDSVAPAALTCFDAMRTGHPSTPIFISGFSLGTAAGLYVAAHRPVAGMLLHNPPPIRQIILGRYGWWNLFLLAGPIAAQIPEKLDSIRWASRVTAPAIFVTAGSDSIVPPAYQRKVIEAYGGPKRCVIIQGADHNTPCDEPQILQIQRYLRWLWEQSNPDAPVGGRGSGRAGEQLAPPSSPIRRQLDFK